jgi:hypothetical protein
MFEGFKPMCLKKLVGKPVYLSVVLILAVGAPFHFDLNASNSIVPSTALAKGGGDGDGGSDGGDGDGDGDGSGNSGSGSGNSGNGNGNSGTGRGTGNNSANSSKDRSKTGIRTIERGGGSDIEVHYDNGWTEQIKSGLYELRDNINRTVIDRKAKQEDYDRFQDVSPDR